MLNAYNENYGNYKSRVMDTNFIPLCMTNMTCPKFFKYNLSVSLCCHFIPFEMEGQASNTETTLVPNASQ